MSITPPSSYDTTDFGLAPGGIAVNQAHNAGNLQKLAANHNFLESQYGPIVDACHFPRGINRTAGVGYEELCVWRCAQNIDGRSLTATVTYKNANVSTGGNIRFRVDSTNGDIAVSASTALTTSSVTVAAPSGGAYTIRILTDFADIKIYSVTVRYAAITGSVSDAKKTSGYQWFQPSAEFAATEPLTTEHVDRFLVGPKAVYRAHPWCAVTLTDAVNGEIYDYGTTSTSYVTVALIPVMVPVDSSYTWSVLGYGPAGSKVSLTGVGPSKEISLSQTAMPSPLDGTQVYTFDTAAADIPRGPALLRVELKSGTGGQTSIYGVQLIGG